jgi:hypothetical protein
MLPGSNRHPSGAIMTRSLSTLLLLSLLLACTGLSRAADEKKMPTTPFYPLAVGNTWSYRVGENHFSLKVAKAEEVEDKQKKKTPCVRMELIVNGKTTSFEQIGVTSDAVVRYTFEGKTADPPIPFLKLPPKKGETWKFESRVDGQLVKGTFTAGEEDATVVPAGKYKTVTVIGKDIEVNGVKMNLTYHFAENVGMVKQVIEYAGQKAVIELEKFEPAK